MCKKNVDEKNGQDITVGIASRDVASLQVTRREHVNFGSIGKIIRIYNQEIKISNRSIL